MSGASAQSQDSGRSASDEHLSNRGHSPQIRHMLQRLRSQLQEKAAAFSGYSVPLVFQSPPTPFTSGDIPGEPQIVMLPNRGPLPLKPGAPENVAFLNYQAWLMTVYSDVMAVISSGEDVAGAEFANAVRQELSSLEEMKRREWVRQRNRLRIAREQAAAGIPTFDTASILTPPDVSRYPVYFVCHLLLAVLNIMCNVSVHRCNDFVIPVIRTILRETQREYGNPEIMTEAEDGIPGGIETILSFLGVKPSLQSFVCCPTCFACYHMDEAPPTCHSQRAPDLPACGCSLFTEKKSKGQVVSRPQRKLHVQDFRHWLGQFLCRPGMEDILDRDVYDTGATGGELFDIWDGEFLRKFCGPDGTKYIQGRASRTLRLVFAICMDNFNPFFNKHGGKHYSSGAISLICLNLPPGMRHLLENIFVFCVYPGPHEPQTDNINNILCHLVDAFLPFWEPGIYYSSTPKYPEGRLVNGAIVLAVSDLLAARQLSGINRWCTQCELEAADMENLDETTWPKRHTGEEHRRLAEEWKSLPSKKRNAHFKIHKIRWSELLRLPYWDPVIGTVVEFSHNLLGVNVKHHLRDVLGMDVELQDGLRDEEPAPQQSAEDLDPLRVNDAWDKVLHAEDRVIKGLSAALLRECCRRAKIATGGRHKALFAAIQQYVKRRDNGLVTQDGTPTNPKPQPAPTDPPSELEISLGEATLARRRNKKAMMSIKKNVLEQMVSRRLQSLDSQSGTESSTGSIGSLPSISSIASSTKPKLIDTLFELEHIEDGEPAPAKPSKATAVFGSQMLSTIHQDLRRMTFPSWIGRVPYDLGSARHGTLSHDALRTAATVIIPSSLTRVWGLKPTESRERQILENYLDLSTSIILGLLRRSSIEDADNFHDLWLRHLTGVRVLFPHIGFVPSQHIALHLSTNIKNFGPAPGQRSNVCERINFLLQKTPTNSKPGEMELTMITRFCAAQNIRAMMRSLPQELQVVAEAFTQAFDSDGRGTLQEEIGSNMNSEATFENTTTLKRLPNELYELLKTRARDSNSLPFRHAFMQTHINYRRKTFSTFDHSRSDSCIVFTDLDGDGWYAGRIADIFVQEIYTGDHSADNELDEYDAPRYEMTLAVQRFSTLDTRDALHDPYLAQNRDVGLGCLCYLQPDEKKILIGVADIVCHAMCHANRFPGISAEVMHVMPLLRESRS